MSSSTGGRIVANRQARGRGELESAVLDALLASSSAMTAGEVLQALPGGLAYTTVLTILVRLHDKGALERERRGRAYAYRPVSDEPGLAARRMRRVLDERPDRDAVLARFVDDLSDDDEQALRRLLGE
jgi:predicted transcriptional regulator